MNRLTHQRVNGIKQGYWAAAKKDELVERLAAYEDTGLTPEEITRFIKEHDWIPCRDREPEESGTYLTTVALPFNCKETDIKHYSETRGWTVRHNEFFVTAWQPLPEPWEGDKE